MTETHSDFHRRIVRAWLLCVAALMVVVVLVGGATRLTESGLSIVEWKPVVGTLPPLSEQDWQTEFRKYQQIPQYRELNRGMTLDQFKTIFWWEWSHRLLARTVGFVFLLPFLFFLWRGWIARGFRARLWAIFAMGGALGAVGWWMVSSGLTERVSVSQYRLAFHLTLACAIYAAIVWTAQEMVARPAAAAARPRHRVTALALAGLVVLQIYLGALVAGLDAGLVYNTWPLIDGHFIPDSARLFFEQPAWRNLFENTLTVQFNHRMAAYLLFVLAVWHALDMRQAADRGASRRALLLAAAMTVQALVGIATLVHQTPISLALLHQGTALVVLTIAVVHAEGMRPRQRAAWQSPPLQMAGAKP